MTRYALKRLAAAVLVLLVVSVVVFSLLHLSEGDPAAVAAGPDADAAAIEATRHELGLDRPLPVQYADWLGGMLTGDPGESYISGQPVAELIGQRVASTVQLMVAAVLLMILLGVLMGVVLGTTRIAWLRRAIDGLATVALALPPFVSGVILIFLFATLWQALPSGGEAPLLDETASSIRRLILPAVALALPAAPVIARLLATEMRRNAQEEFVLTATSKGAGRRRITWRHVFPNSVGPPVTELGIRIGQLLGGAVVAEAIFARSGLGQLLVQAVQTRDYPLAQALLLLAITAAILAQLLAELVTAAVDPRVRQVVTA